jgi:cyanophycinase
MSTSPALRSILFAFAAVILAATCADAQTPKGTLFIIGGGDRTPEMMRRFIDLAGGPEEARIVVIPNASGDGDTSCMDMAEEFHALGVRNVGCCFLNREQASDPNSAKLLDGATGVYFTGGDQVRVTKALVGTPIHRKLLDLYANGAVMGGTSAGAALMSKVMITGDERLNKDTIDAFVFIKKDNVVTVEGIGFLTNVIIDQHFVTRKRHNRLISVVLEHPELIAVGIDEATAIIVHPRGVFDVIGRGNVVVYDATQAKGIRTDPRGNLAAGGIIMHLLVAGDSFDTKTRSVATAGKTQ